MWQPLRLLALLVLGLCLSQQAWSRSGTVGLVSSLEGGYFSQFLQILGNRLRAEQIPLRLVSPDTLRNTPTQETPALLVAAGTQACHDALAHSAIPTLCVFVSRDGYHGLAKDAERSRHSAIYLDQPIARQVHLARLIEPDAERISVLLGPQTAYLRETLRQIAETQGTAIETITVRPNGNPAPRIQKELARNDILLAIPDPDVYNRHTIHGVLLTTYRKGIPVIGFSESFVNAGAVASVYSTAQDIALATSDAVQAFFRGSDTRLPEPAPPSYFSISVNPRVARALGIDLPETAEIRNRLSDMESGTK